MLNVSEKLYRGSRPVCHKDLEVRGIKTVINLQSGVYTELNDDTYEMEIPGEFGIVSHNVPLSDFSAPKNWQVEKVLRIIGNSQGLVYIHCLHGKDRTGFMCAAFRMLMQRWTYEKAKEEMFKLGFHKIPYLLWLPALKNL